MKLYIGCRVREKQRNWLSGTRRVGTIVDVMTAVETGQKLYTVDFDGYSLTDTFGDDALEALPEQRVVLH